jgi:hypothetical protein
MCKGNAHTDVERRTIPADYKLLNSALAISSFCGSRRWALAKKGGMSAPVDVVLHSMGRIGHHITSAEYRGKFLKQKFNICRHGIRIRLNRKG